MEELARKGSIKLYQDKENDYWYEVGVIQAHPYLTLEVLSDLKDCISQVTAKKWKERTRALYNTIYYECPDCVKTMNDAYNFCPNCGIYLPEVEE